MTDRSDSPADEFAVDRLPEMPLGSFDIAFGDFWTQPIAVREAAFKTLREQDPVPWFDSHPEPSLPIDVGPGYWSLTTHAHVLEASRNPEVFSSARGATSIADLPPEFNEFFGGFINMDDPRHGHQRRIVSRGFTPRALAQLDHAVEERAQAVIDRVIEKGECDFVTDIAAPLPLEIICDMMGIPESQAQMVFDKTNVILGLGDPEFVPPGGNVIAAAMGAGAELAALMNEMGAERKKRPTDDLTSQLLNADLDSEGALTDEELASFFVLLVVAGNETTRNAISHGMKALCDNPDERRKWMGDFERHANTAVDEIVRWASPVIHMRRTLTRDYEMGGKTLKEGEKAVLWYGSANRDATVFEDPFRFDVARTPNEHVGFGGPGPHFCLGANLARREIRIMFQAIFERLPDLEITGPPERLRSNFINGIKRMPCQFTPGSRRS